MYCACCYCWCIGKFLIVKSLGDESAGATTTKPQQPISLVELNQHLVNDDRCSGADNPTIDANTGDMNVVMQETVGGAVG